MELSPQKVRSMSFSSTKKGYDRTEVDTFVTEVATALETAQNETTAMEARARAAIARLKEISTQQPEAPAESDAPEPQREPAVSVDEQETISRTLLLAQRTADATVADATAKAEMMVADATAEAERTLSQSRDEANKMVAEARIQARLALEEDRIAAENEVNELRGRRDVLEADVQHLEEFLIAQRDRIRAATVELTTIIERVPDGLGNMRRPLLSSIDDGDTDTNGDIESGTDDVDGAASDAGIHEPDVSGSASGDEAAAVGDDRPPEDGDANEAIAASSPTAVSADDETVELDAAELRAAAATADVDADGAATDNAADGEVEAADGTPAGAPAPPFEFGLAHDESSPTQRSS